LYSLLEEEEEIAAALDGARGDFDRGFEPERILLLTLLLIPLL
jgi:hypothetical protein